MKPYFIDYETVSSLGKSEPYQDNGLTMQYEPINEDDTIVMCSGNFRDNTPKTKTRINMVISKGNISGSLYM